MKHVQSGKSPGEALPLATSEFRKISIEYNIRVLPLPYVRVGELAEMEKRHAKRLEEEEQHRELITQAPRPLALTQTGRREQERHIIRRREAPIQQRTGIESLLGIRNEKRRKR